jgi:hypothetical protein
MKKLCVTSMAALLATAGATFSVPSALAANAKLSKTECSAIWGRADSAGSGSLTSSQAQSYVSDFSKVDANADGQLSSAEFMSGCQKGLVHDSASTGAGEGASGSAGEGSEAPKAPQKY